MKVLHIEDRFHPGMGYQINFFARYHHPDLKFSILSSDSSRLWTASDYPIDLKLADKQFEEEFNVSVYRLSSFLDRRSRQNLWMRGLIRTIRKLDPDILYVHTLETYTSIRILLNRTILSKYRVFFDTHTLLNQFKPGLKSSLLKYFFRKVARKRILEYGAKVFATVAENRMILEREYGISPAHILYSPIGTDLTLFHYDEQARLEGRQREQLEVNGVLLLYTGKMNERKNPHLILDAVELLADRIDRPLYIYFVGAADPAYKEHFLNREYKHGQFHFRLVPAVAVTELSAWYSMADFAVFPNENTLSALDAQACRLPLIMASDLTNDERLSQGGMTYTSGDLVDLSQNILELIMDAEKRRNMGSRGETFVRSTYDYKKIVRDMESDLGLFH